MHQNSATVKQDVIVIGAGAAGFMCAIEAGKRSRSVLLLDHAKKPAEKIRISGGGRCNFINQHATPANYISDNPHFCKSAFSRYTQHDFIALVEKHNIAYHEKTLGQLFCDGSSQQIIDMLLTEATENKVTLQLETTIEGVKQDNEGLFQLVTNKGNYTAESLVIATGGLSIPKMGATDFGYRIAKQFGVPIVPQAAALVPFLCTGEVLENVKSIAGLAVDITAICGKTIFKEAMLFTHRGLSGPAILQISSYWEKGDIITIDLAPRTDILQQLLAAKSNTPKHKPVTILAKYMPKRLAALLAVNYDEKLAELSHAKLQILADSVNQWQFTPDETEGYRTAEVTRGGVDTNALDAKSMACKAVSNLYFIGEVVDVTGHLGGYNFGWAWSSGYVAGQDA